MRFQRPHDGSNLFSQKRFYIGILTLSFLLTVILLAIPTRRRPVSKKVQDDPYEVATFAPISTPVETTLSTQNASAESRPSPASATEAPEAKPTQAPVNKPTIAPTAKPTIASVKPTQAPTTKSTQTPVIGPAQGFVSQPPKVPVSKPTAAPVAVLGPVVVPAPVAAAPAKPFSPIRINSGGVEATVNENEKVWYTDKKIIPNVRIAGESHVFDRPCGLPKHDELYCSERWFQKDGGYAVTVPNGEYRVSLSFVEIFHDEAEDRVFHIAIEKKIVRRQYDIYKAAGDINKLATENFKTRVVDGELNIDFTKIKQHPKISAVEITQLSAADIVV